MVGVGVGVDVVRGRNSEKVARDGKGVRNGVGRAMALSNDSITAQYDTVQCALGSIEVTRKTKAGSGVGG